MQSVFDFRRAFYIGEYFEQKGWVFLEFIHHLFPLPLAPQLLPFFNLKRASLRRSDD